jgi:hypothetical protein
VNEHTNFDLQIDSYGQVTILPYKQDYLVYEFCSSNRLIWTSNSITVLMGQFCDNNVPKKFVRHGHAGG